MQFLDWFVKEQGEEEKNSDDLRKRYDLFGTDARGLYLLDSELSTRVFKAPSLVV
jgi:ferritin